MAESPRPAYSVQVGLSVFGKVKVDDNVHCLDVYTPGEQIWNQTTKL